MGKIKKVYTTDFKVKLVFELLTGHQTLNQTASKYDVTQKSLVTWKKMFIDKAPEAFESSRVAQGYRKEIGELQNLNIKLTKSLECATIELNWVVEKLNSLNIPNKKSLIDCRHESLSLIRQCEILDINRTSLYYKQKPSVVVSAGAKPKA